MRSTSMFALFVLVIAMGVAFPQQANSSNQQQPNQGSTAKTSVTPGTAQSESTQNTAGSIAGNSGAIGTTPGVTKPQDPSIPQKSAASNNAPAGNATSTVENTPTAEAIRSAKVPDNGAGTAPEADSQTLRSEIDSALKSDPSLSGSQLEVAVDASNITLSGTVPSGKQKVTATRIAQSYGGNRRLQDHVTVAGQTNSQQPNAMAKPQQK